jgi:spore coat-associated protein N
MTTQTPLQPDIEVSAVAEDDRDKKRGFLLLATAAIVLALGATTFSSLALFSDSETSTNNTFTTATLDLTVAPASTAITGLNLVPGSGVTAPLTITNSGSLALRYSMISVTTEDVLATELVMTIKSGVATCDSANFGGSGTVLFNGTLGATGAGVPVLGDSAQGNQAGDRILAPAGSEDLCIDVQLPLSAPNPTQGLSTTATFTVNAEQTDNNP